MRNTDMADELFGSGQGDPGGGRLDQVRRVGDGGGEGAGGRGEARTKEAGPLREQSTAATNTLLLGRSRLEPAFDTRQKRHRQKSVPFLWRALRSSNP